MGLPVESQLAAGRGLSLDFRSVPFAGDPDTSASLYKGQLGLALTKREDSQIDLSLSRLGIIGRGFRVGTRATGEMSIGGLDGQGELTRISPGRWRIDAEIRTQVLYEALEIEGGFRRTPGSDNYIPNSIELFSGRLLAIADERDLLLNNNLVIASGSLDLRRSDGGLGIANNFSFDLQGSSLPVLVARPPDCPLGHEGIRRSLQLVPIVLSGLENDTEMKRAWDRQITAAAAIWEKCCVRFEHPGTFQPVDNQALKSQDPQVAKTAFIAKDPNLIEVFLVAGPVSDGGGATFSGGTSLAKVVITAENNGNDNLLAHELGHVLGGLHPNDSPEPGRWIGEKDTVMEFSTETMAANPDKNSLANCRSVKNACLFEAGDPCCLRPSSPPA